MSGFDTSPFTPLEVRKPWGKEIHLTRQGLPYMFKILCIDAGKRISLQYHDQKKESWLLKSGRAKLIWQKEKGGKLVETVLEEGKVYTCEVGQQHRLQGITDCEIWEVSTPEIGTTIRVQDDWERKDETPYQRKLRDQGKLTFDN